MRYRCNERGLMPLWGHWRPGENMGLMVCGERCFTAGAVD